jgi:HK97 family phage major capsid protein
VLWGVPVVQTMASPANTLVTGDYANYAFLGIRRGLDMQITNSHSTHFIEGKQAIRVDMRAVMVHVRPKAFGTLTGLAN